MTDNYETIARGIWKAGETWEERFWVHLGTFEFKVPLGHSGAEEGWRQWF